VIICSESAIICEKEAFSTLSNFLKMFFGKGTKMIFIVEEWMRGNAFFRAKNILENTPAGRYTFSSRDCFSGFWLLEAARTRRHSRAGSLGSGRFFLIRLKTHATENI